MNKAINLIGMYLLMDGTISLAVFKDQDSWYQIPRVIRAFLGAYLVVKSQGW